VETHVFDFLARVTTRWPKSILLATLIFIGLTLVYGAKASQGLQSGGQTDPGSQSSQAESLLNQKFSAGQPNLVLLVSAPQGVDQPEVAAEGATLSARLSTHPQLMGVSSYWSTHSPLMRSKDGKSALIVGYIRGTENDERDFVNAYGPSVEGKQGPATVQLGGTAVARNAVTTTVRGDISNAEKIGIPLTALVLILVFRSFVAALLPLLVGVIAVIGTNAELRGLSTFTNVSIFALNLATGLSLGLAADYGLFIVRRYREEYHSGAPIPEAIRTTLNTAGRTVAFSSLTVAVAMSSMLVFPLYFLRSFAYAGISVVLLAAAAALIALPAGLVALGKHVDALDFTKIPGMLLRRSRPRAQRNETRERNGWRRIAEAVMRRPLLYALSTSILLAMLIIPFLHVNYGLPDDRLLPAGAESHVVQQDLRDHYDAQITNQLDVVAKGIDPAAEAGKIDGYAKQLSTVAHVVRVEAVTGVYVGGKQVEPAGPATAALANSDSTYLTVASSADQISAAGKDLTKAVRAVPAPFPLLVGGASADLVDALSALGSHLPWAIGIIAATTLLLIFLLTGSVLIPFKALLMNTLSLSATFGALVWIFQDNHLAGLLNFQRTGFLDVTLLVLLFCVAFGVSMDYEVFLLSRIKEEYKRTGDNRTAVAFGIEKTGGVVTAAALITSIVFIVMGLTSRVTNIKLFGVGLALAMLMDASVIRTILVPALMRLAGRANWWRPAFLHGFYDRFKLRDDYDPADAAAVALTATDLERPPVGAREAD
jgi:RND superfamily putative drug exporter